jgi:glyoxylase-like metal-dependent hydrolase (beta-lactamase superfamily II)
LCSVCYYFEHEGFLISGDTLFFESYGRTDFPTGNDREMKESLTQLLTQLKDEVIVYPGHGCATNIGYEKRNNPWSLSIFE